jgi:hypothetical protein
MLWAAFDCAGHSVCGEGAGSRANGNAATSITGLRENQAA